MPDFIQNIELLHILFAGYAVFFLSQIYYYCYYFSGIVKEFKQRKKKKRIFIPELPPVSVIICARNEAENLKRFLPFVLEQDYTAFEVIVINDGSIDETDKVLADLKQQYTNLYETKIPNTAKVPSRKKLAITLGIKAAKNELLLFTDADCKPINKQWIKSMIRNFDPATEIVLGYGGYFSEKTFINRLISYDTLFIAIQYMGAAMAHRPYMGVGRNIAYRKSSFMRLGGFAGMLQTQSGDDDLLVNAMADRHNTKIEISPESITKSVAKSTLNTWFRQKERHLSTAKSYKGTHIRHLAIEVVSRAMFYVSFMAILFFDEQIWIFIATIMLLIRYIVQAFIINMSAKVLNEKRRYYFTLLLFDIILPVIYLAGFAKQLFHRKKHVYNWK